MEPFHPEAPEAANAQEQERQRRDKERLLKRLRKWRERRNSEAEPEKTIQAQSATPEADELPTTEERKGKFMGKVLNYFIARPTPEQPSATSAEINERSTEVLPRFRRIRQVTNRVLTRVVETHDQVRAVATVEMPTPQLKEEESSLQAVEWELRRVSDQFDAALQTEGLQAETRQGPPRIEDPTGYAEHPASPVESPLAEHGDDYRPAFEQNLPDNGTPAIHRMDQYRPVPSKNESWQNQPRENPHLASSVLRVASIPEQRPPSVEHTVQLRQEAETLQRNQQTVENMQREHVDMRDAVSRHQRVQETVNLARSQAEVVSQATQAIHAERPAHTAAAPESFATRPSVVQGLERPPQPTTVNASPETPQPQESYDAWRPLPGESIAASVAAAEKAPATQLSKEAPTEKELSDRVERDPGNNWQSKTAQQQAADDQSSLHPTLPMPVAQDPRQQLDRHDHRQRDKAPWQQPNTSWLAVAVLVVIIAGLVMLSLSF